jgi:uncharacterized protein (DUF362 family)
VNDATAYLDALAAQAHSDGGWGYALDKPAHLEPTCLALLALAPEPERYRAILDRGLDFLGRCANPDGSYRPAHGREEAVWPTALVLFLRATLGHDDREIGRTAGYLLALRGQDASSKEAEEIHDIDLNLVGWPWAHGNFSWVEPTAWACLALSRAGFGDHPRVEEGRRLLLDRALDEGGINYGNRRILGRILDPIPGPTALMLLALQGHEPHPRIDAALTYLGRQALAGDDLEHLCWARLALDVHRARPGVTEALANLTERIHTAHKTRLLTEWLRPAPLREALTALALAADQRNPFRLAGATSPRAEAVAPPSAKRRPLGERFKAAFKSFVVSAAGNLRPIEPLAEVHVAPVADYNADLADVLARQYEHFRERVPLKGKRVVLKPNLVEFHRDKVINTHPHVIAAAIEWCRREGAAEVIVAEGPGHWRNAEYLVAASGLGDVLRHHKTSFFDLNHDEPVKTLNVGRCTKLDHLFLAQTVATADVLISLPKLKTHHWAVATLALKNLFGTLPGICYGWPKNELHWRGIENSIVDIALTRTPDLCIVDGIVGMEGDGPLNGTPKATGVLVMGRDPVAVDATCCRLMQLDPHRVGYLALGARKRLGVLHESQIRQLGETIADRAQPFETVAHFADLRTTKVDR